MTFNPTIDQERELQGLAYWVADVNYIREKYGDTDPELMKADDRVKFTFEVLDRLGVPFWVQNMFICFAENWRDYLNYGTGDLFKKIQEGA